MHVAEQYFTHEGVTLTYFQAGSGKPLLFLPGGLHVTSYFRNIELLTKSYRVIGLDLPGFGKSSIPQAVWSLEDYARFISAFINHLRLPKIPVVGHSYGGGVGLFLAMKNIHVSKLMVFSPMGVESKHSPFMFYFHVLVTKSIYDFLR